MSYAAPNSTHKVEPYTKYPNIYTDTLKYGLTSTQRDVCDVVIRETYGWHRSSARISTSKFIDTTGRSRRSIISAKQQLIDMGLLVMLEHGGGSYTSEYTIDLHYNRPDKRQPAQLSIEDEDKMDDDELSAHEDALSISSIESDTSTDINTVTTDSPTYSTTSVSNTEPDDSIVSPLSTNDVDTVTNTPIDDECEVITDEYEVNGAASSTPPTITDASSITPTNSNLSMQISPGSVEDGELTVDDVKSDSTMPLEPVVIHVDEPLGGANNALPANKDLRGIININKTNNNTTPNVISKFGSGTATIRCLFSNHFPKSIENNDWGYFGYLVTTYGMEICKNKINYMSEHRKSHTITNPKGFLRCALQFDYQMPKSILLKVKADESARLAGERTRRESKEWRTMVSKFDYSNASAALSKLIEILN